MASSKDLPHLQGSYIYRFFNALIMKPIPPPNDLDLSGQTAILVGGTDGIGLACARLLLGRNLSTLILGARNMGKGRDVAKQLTERGAGSHPDPPQVQVWELELLSYDSVRGFAKRCEGLDRIDFVIIGASVMPSSFRLNPSTGHELTIQLHYWSTALLSLLLVPILKEKHPKGKPAHLTLIGSDLIHITEFEEGKHVPLLPAFDSPVPWNPNLATKRYIACKLLVAMFVSKLKDFVDPADVIVNSVCPGMSKPTANEREQPRFHRYVTWIVKNLLGRPLEVCAWLYLYAAVEQGPESHGSFTASWKFRRDFPKLMHTEEGKLITERAWKETLEAFTDSTEALLNPKERVPGNSAKAKRTGAS
ncbi:hypothetical protein GE09DRAFT_1035075 [Coniochaeta sp. 2T2.1]|nr:hypothetical protein GE09DRAFT_1035075 [Coniochaeta sp. 2T2.1]